MQKNNIQSVIASVRESLNLTVENEKDHLRRGRVERNFTTALAQKISEKVNIHDMRVDPFYNRHLNASKRLDGRIIELDIAVHTRGTDENNLVAIELETTNAPTRDDVWKIEGLTSHLDGYEYKLGLYLVVGIEERAGEILVEEWYEGGKLRTS